jgi:hypothetical protein
MTYRTNADSSRTRQPQKLLLLLQLPPRRSCGKRRGSKMDSIVGNGRDWLLAQSLQRRHVDSNSILEDTDEKQADRQRVRIITLAGQQHVTVKQLHSPALETSRLSHYYDKVWLNSEMLISAAAALKYHSVSNVPTNH